MFLNLHEFISRLMDEIYKPMGLTILYVPKERLLQTLLKSSNKNDYISLNINQTLIFSEEDEKKRKLIERLDKVVWFWIGQMHRTTITLKWRKIKNIQDEVDYWNAKRSNLNLLHTQFLNIEVQLIVDILKNLRSPSAFKLKELIMYADTKFEEASSNLIYLNIVFNFCKNLQIPDNIENFVTEVLLLILFIWIESPFYSHKNNMEILCQALSSQIMEQCINYINLDIAFKDDPEIGIQMLEKCIFCCNIYKTIYDHIMTNITTYINSNKKWDINRKEVFNKIDIFQQRCYDIIEICEALTIFGRNGKIKLIGGPKGVNYETYWRKIEFLFYESLGEIITARNIIFTIIKPVWVNKMKQFRYTILQLENMVINLINNIFKNIKNIEEGIEAIYALQKFKKRKNLQKILQNKWIQIWKIFSNEIEHCYINVIRQSKKKINNDVNLLCISQYLKNQYSIIINALDWIGDCNVGKCILQQYEQVLDVIDKKQKMFNIYNTNIIY